MSNLRYALLCLLGLTLAACTQDPVVDSLTETHSTAEPIDAQEMIADAEATIEEALAEIKAHQAAVAKGPAVYVPAGSTDALADALAAAGPNGRVVLESGPHYESETVVIEQRVRLEGEPGAILYSSAAAADLSATPTPILPALHVKGANQARLVNLDIRPVSGLGNTAILVEDTRNARIYNSRITDFTQGVVLFGADHAQVVGNTIIGSDVLGLEGTNGIFVFAGKYVRLFNNEVSTFGSNIFTSDTKGLAFGNYVHDGETGIIVCTAPPNYESPDGEIMQAPISSNQWLIFGNDSRNNFGIAYAIIDGAFNNRVFQNKASDTGILDIVLFPAFQGETMFFPVTRDNMVISTFFPDVTIMDCGDDNIIIGGTDVDCFL